MIKSDLFMQKIKKASLLTGFPVEVEVAQALFDELKTEQEKDFLLALKDLSYSGDRINLANILKHLNKHKTDRIEREAQVQKKEEEETAISLLKQEGIPEEIKAFLSKFKKIDTSEDS